MPLTLNERALLSVVCVCLASKPERMQGYYRTLVERRAAAFVVRVPTVVMEHLSLLHASHASGS